MYMYVTCHPLSYCIKPVSLESARCEGSGQKRVSDFAKLEKYGLVQVWNTLISKRKDLTLSF